MAVGSTEVTALAGSLTALGLEAGGVVLVHASLRGAGGTRAGTMLDALLRVLGPRGTLVTPSFTPENSDSSSAHRARVAGLDPREAAAVRGAMPPFDPASTPAPGMGVLSETLRTVEGAVRSAHPQTSFVAYGPAGDAITAEHGADCHLGERSPLAALYRARARVLLLGVGFDVCSAFHLAEYRVPRPPLRTYRCVVVRGGRRSWWSYEDVALDDSDFAALGAAYEAEGTTRTGTVSGLRCRLLDLREAVDFAVRWMPVNRPRRAGTGARTGPGAGPGLT
ncbi:AAC(3) family N-acetyltransferase [Streptomyces sp. PA03-1a]|nr:AAC(3) family N-acetyltransferase [Streptomyces sp. PA03-1a]MDX2812672.1 AAC(3) family N-acetyltransferase [Streptomyces sp. PA03-5A]